jgi:hypothetical protein
LTKKIDILNSIVTKAALADQISDKTVFLRKAHRLLLDSGYVYPLGEVLKQYFYPKSISKVIWADRVSGIPMISELR